MTKRKTASDIASDQFIQTEESRSKDWLDDRTRGDKSPHLYNPLDSFTEKFARDLLSEPAEEARLFGEKAAAWMGWKKTAAFEDETPTAPISKEEADKATGMEKHTECSTCRRPKEKCACGDKVAFLSPVKNMAARVGDNVVSGARRASGVAKKAPGAAADLNSRAALSRPGQAILDAKGSTVAGAGALTGAAGGALSADPEQGQSRLRRAVLGAGLGAGAAAGGRKLLQAGEGRAWNKATAAGKQRAADFGQASPEQAAAARAAAKAGIKVPASEMAPVDALRMGKTAEVRAAFMRAVDPTVAASSESARKGELVAKVAATLPAHADDDIDRLADKVPSEALPKGAVDQHVEDFKNKVMGAVDKYRKTRTEVTSGPKEKKVRLPRPPGELMKELPKTASIKDKLQFFKDPGALALMGTGAAIGGGATLAANKGRKRLGGKSPAEVDLEEMVAAQQAQGEEGASFPKRLKNRYVEFSKGLATDFRKNPGQAAALGAVTGATAGALAARMMGVGK